MYVPKKPTTTLLLFPNLKRKESFILKLASLFSSIWNTKSILYFDCDYTRYRFLAVNLTLSPTSTYAVQCVLYHVNNSRPVTSYVYPDLMLMALITPRFITSWARVFVTKLSSAPTRYRSRARSTYLLSTYHNLLTNALFLPLYKNSLFTTNILIIHQMNDEPFAPHRHRQQGGLKIVLTI